MAQCSQSTLVRAWRGAKRKGGRASPVCSKRGIQFQSKVIQFWWNINTTLLLMVVYLSAYVSFLSCWLCFCSVFFFFLNKCTSHVCSIIGGIRKWEMILKLIKWWMKSDGWCGDKEYKHGEQILTLAYFLALAAFHDPDLRCGHELDL